MEPQPWSKARFLAVYWTAQAAMVYVLWPLLFGAGWLEVWRDPWLFGTVAAVLLSIMAGQGVLLAPIRKPGGPSGSALGRWSGHLMGGMAAGAMAGYVVVLVMTVLSAWEMPGWLQPLNVGPWPFLAPLLAVTPLATFGLASRARDGVPVLLTVAIAACLAASLALGLGLGLMALFMTALGPKRSLVSGPPREGEDWWILGVIAVMGLAWLVATPLLLVFFRGRDRESALARLSSRLFLGTVIEAAAIIPLDVMVRRKTACYCAEGTMWALTICWGVGTLVLGPAIWLVPMGRRRKRWLAGRCPVCEYDMRGCAGAERCPECGAGWRPATPPSWP